MYKTLIEGCKLSGSRFWVGCLVQAVNGCRKMAIGFYACSMVLRSGLTGRKQAIISSNSYFFIRNLYADF